ncbi:MAG: hypothetical protein QOG85_521, partial [Gaiellaceae bacterium]|nr:hypothetical protein [Gaiellaceae bacterium]
MGAAVRPVAAGIDETWAGVTAFGRPYFVPHRWIVVSSAAGFWRAWNHLRAGDEIVVHGVTFHGEAVFAKQLVGWAEVHFDASTTFA